MIEAFILAVWLPCGVVAADWLLCLVRHDLGPRDLMMATMLVCAGPIGLLFMASFYVGDDGEDEE